MKVNWDVINVVILPALRHMYRSMLRHTSLDIALNVMSVIEFLIQA